MRINKRDQIKEDTIDQKKLMFHLRRCQRFRDSTSRKIILKMLEKVMKLNTIKVYKRVFSVGMTLDDLFVWATMSVIRSINCYPINNVCIKEVPFIAFMVTRLKSDLFGPIRKQITLSNKSTNTATLVDWQEDEFKQPKTGNPTAGYIEDEDNKHYIEYILKIPLLSSVEKIAVKRKFNKPLTQDELSKIATDKQLENTWQRARRKLSGISDIYDKKYRR